MKDLDFDELDRAVSSLLGATGSKVESATPETTGLQGNSFEQTTPQDAPASEPRRNPSPAATSRPLATKRSTGRFMDVVHPSSDMKTAGSAAPVSRTGMTITPPTASPEQSAEGTQDVPQAPLPEVKPVDTPAEVETSVTQDEHAFPDPLDFHGFTGEDETPASAEPGAPAEESGVSVSEEPTTPDAERPALDSPFLTGAKIEKRPLGAFSVETNTDTQAEPAPVEELEAPQESSEDTQTPIDTDTNELVSTEEADKSVEDDPQTTPQAEALPEELHEDLLSIESDENAVAHDAPAEPVSPVSQPTSAQPLAAGSIVQQYKAAAAEAPAKDPTPIYDTDTYHQPLKHPVKKKSGWLSALLILLLVLLGAGGGAALYYFVL